MPALPRPTSSTVASRTPLDLQVQAQGNAGQWVVAVDHHVLGVDLGDGEQRIGRCVGHAAGGQRTGLQQHAFLDARGQGRACQPMHAGFVVVAERVLGLQVQVQAGAGCVALQGRFDGGQQVMAADQEFDRFGQFIQGLAQAVLQHPGERHHALRGNFHRRIVASQNRPPRFPYARHP